MACRLILLLVCVWISGCSFQKPSGAHKAEPKVLRPYAEYEPVNYVVMESSFQYHSETAKRTILENLPQGVTPVAFVNPEEDPIEVKERFQKLSGRDPIIVDYHSGFWVRDTLPIPVVVRMNDQEGLGLANTTSWGTEPISKVSELLPSVEIRHDNRFDGGNFIADRQGNCLIVHNHWYPRVPDDTFKVNYGCKTLLRLPFFDGIGHADERVKFIADNTVLVDEVDYVPFLESQGFQVILMPKPAHAYATYMNFLLVNGTAFMPVMDLPTDKEAIKILTGSKI